MKRGINFAECVFLFFLLFKCKGWELTPGGGVPSWLVVFTPLIIDWLYSLYAALSKAYGWDKTAAFHLYKWLLNRRLNKAASKARKSYLNGNTGNPGQFVDPLNRGKI